MLVKKCCILGPTGIPLQNEGARVTSLVSKIIFLHAELSQSSVYVRLQTLDF